MSNGTQQLPALKQQLDSVRAFLVANKDKMFAALPKHIDVDRMIAVAVTSVRKNPDLATCSLPSLYSAIMEAASVGLETDSALGHAWLIPFGGEATLILGYKGLIALARRSAEISTIAAEVVYQGDTFNYQLGDLPSIEHVPNDADPDRDSRPISHVYVVVRLKDGGVQRSVWTKAKIDAHKERFAKGWRRKDSPWQTSWPAMAKKTVIRAMVNGGLLPVSIEVQRIADREMEVEVQSQLVPTVSQPQVGDLDDLTRRLEGPADDAVEPQVDPTEAVDAEERPQDAVAPDPWEALDRNYRIQMDGAATVAKADAAFAAYQDAAIDTPGVTVDQINQSVALAKQYREEHKQKLRDKKAKKPDATQGPPLQEVIK